MRNRPSCSVLMRGARRQLPLTLIWYYTAESISKKTNIFAFAEELRQQTGKDVDAFEISEIEQGTPFYNAVMREGIRIA